MGMLWPTLEFMLGIALVVALLVGGHEVLTHRISLEPSDDADMRLVRYAEHILASALGAASSRLVMSLLLRQRTVSTKAALRSMTRTFARELIDRGIRVNAVSPGPIDTGILERSMPADAARQFLAEMRAANPMQRLGEPEEVAKAIAFLAFDATYTTGAELLVDGGACDL